jgi:hypothetical protein
LNFVTFCATGVNSNPGIAGNFALNFNSKSYGFLLSHPFQQAGQHPDQGCPACSDFIGMFHGCQLPDCAGKN